jgi:hypothetical protein
MCNKCGKVYNLTQYNADTEWFCNDCAPSEEKA